MYEISKEFRFEAAHRLVAPYEGKCRSLHGHSWSVTAHVSGDHLDARGFVMDFAELNPLKKLIQDRLDHATLVSGADHELLNWLRENGQKHFIVDGNATCETLARRLFEEARALGLPLTSIEIQETCTSRVTYRP